MINKYINELEFAKKTALETWTRIKTFYVKGISAETKSDNTPVTIADKTANDFILSSIQRYFPEDSIVNEEEENVVRGNRTWHIDPIDGTSGFVKHNGNFAIHIGLAVEGSPVLGVVYAPISKVLYYGVPGFGAFKDNGNSERLVINSADPSELVAMISSTSPIPLTEKVFRDLGVSRFVKSGSEGLRIIQIAKNDAHLRINESPTRVSTWDICAPHAIFEAAGGIAEYIDGTPIKYLGQRTVGRHYYFANSRTLGDKVIKAWREVYG